MQISCKQPVSAWELLSCAIPEEYTRERAPNHIMNREHWHKEWEWELGM